MTTANPSAMMQLVAAALPEDLHQHVLLVGSLAAAYHYRDKLSQEVTTKDADVIIQPAGALDTCQAIARRLRGLGWQQRPDAERPPGASASADNLPVVRLVPSNGAPYFVELLGMPEPGQTEAVVRAPIQLGDGWYCVPSFRFMRVLEVRQRTGERGLHYAHPAMMALANALAHPELGTQRMSGLIGGRSMLRSAKDLGRILGLAWLEGAAGLDAWPDLWVEGLRTSFPNNWSELALRACRGIRALVSDRSGFEEAYHSLVYGLLSSTSLTLENLRAIGEQFEMFVLERVQELASSQAKGGEE